MDRHADFCGEILQIPVLQIRLDRGDPVQIGGDRFRHLVGLLVADLVLVGDDDVRIPERRDAVRQALVGVRIGRPFGAIKAGMCAATGECRIFTDGDIPYELEAIHYMYNIISTRHIHVVVGDRNLPGSEYAEQLTLVRSIVTHIFTFFVRSLVTAGLFDTQCGIKGFRGDVADALFPMLRDSGFSGDVELLYVCLKYNLEIKRVPVRLRRSAPSTVRVVNHGMRMLRRISRLRRSWKKGFYYSDKMSKLADQTYWVSE